MQLRHLIIENFRGISHLEWYVPTGVVGLVGPGDSRKTTILEAIEYVLSPRWNIQITDADFYDANTDKAIRIEATVSDLPSDILREYKFNLRGWDSDINDFAVDDEPEDGSKIVVTIRLLIDAGLEPEWRVVTRNNVDGVAISAGQRERLGIARVGSQVDFDLTWARGSALFRKMGGSGEAIQTLREAGRIATKFFAGQSLSELQAAALSAGKEAGKFGVSGTEFKPGLDPQFLLGRTGAVCLHDDRIPLRMDGLASRRLVALALQMECVDNGAILLVDEIEYGLEPYRLRNVLRLLSNYVANGDVGQVILTTHSAVATHEMAHNNVCVVRADGCGNTIVNTVPIELRNTVEACPEALLAPKLVICEGKTEYGLLQAFDKYWTRQHHKPLAHEGVGIINGGGGDAAAKRAMDLSQLGYLVAFFGDSDKDTSPSHYEIKQQGTKVVVWNGSVATEERVASDLPAVFLEKMVAKAAELRAEVTGETEKDSQKALVQSIWSLLGVTTTAPSCFRLEEWIKEGFSIEQIRDAIGRAAKKEDQKKGKHAWFKTIEGGITLGEIIIEALPEISKTPLALTLTQLEGWIYGA